MYDAIIVGARCAGSPLAMLLARKGYKVLVVDKAVFPSDTISTHHIHQPGVKKLKDWGILEKIRAANTPATSKIKFDVGPFALEGIPTPAGEMVESFAPRRRILDTILAESAIEAGAEFRGGFTVTELLWDGDRVKGIRGRNRYGATITEKAKIVIGADGARSFVAKNVQAPIIIDRGKLTCNYYSYFSGIPVEGAELYPRTDNMFVVDATNDDLTLVVAVWKQNEFQRVQVKPRSGVYGRARLASTVACRPRSERQTRRAFLRHGTNPEFYPPTVRRGLGFGRRRGLSQRPGHGAGHHRQLYARGNARRSIRRSLFGRAKNARSSRRLRKKAQRKSNADV